MFTSGIVCTWTLDKQDQLSTTFADVKSYDDIRKMWVQYLTPKPGQVSNWIGGSPVSVPGLGDEAFIIPGYSSATHADSKGRTIYVKAGARSFAISLLSSSDTTLDIELTALAKSVVDRLGKH